jgi:mRNA degradation ribonuclease J1/J2
MTKAQTQKTEEMQLETVKFLSLGGEEDVTRNRYVYEYKDQILLVDCGLGFPDETMLGVDLLLPDITYLLQNRMPEGKAKKKIVGMLLTHGHEDHKGITALLSDCLGAERPGFTPSEEMLTQNLEKTMRDYQGKVFITTNSSNVSRLNQAIEAAEKLNRKVCFVGRSIIKAKRIAQKLGYLHIKQGTEIQIDHIPHFQSNQVMLLVAGSQSQENSAMTRIAGGEFKEIRLQPNDIVIFSEEARYHHAGYRIA